MLSHKLLQRQSISKVSNYYNEGADDYYANEGEAKVWQGKGAEALGLTGEIEAERFQQLLSGVIDPGQENSRDYTRLDSRNRIGIDLTFSAPKSVSMQALIGGDKALILAHDKAVTKALELAEQRAHARRKEHGKSYTEHTGNLIIGKFRHETNRELDPQLHTHGVVMNLTQRADGQWRALKNDEIIKATRFLGAAYRAELAHELQQLGYQLRHGQDGLFELAHISEKQIDAFSQRSAQVEHILAEKGLTRESASSEDKQLATMQSRSHKEEIIDKQALYREWKEKAEALEIALDKRDVVLDGATLQKDRIVDDAATQALAKRSVRYAINHLTERSAVISEEQLIDTAMKHGVGAVRVEDITRAIAHEKESGFLIEGVPRYKKSAHDLGQGETVRTKAGWTAMLVSSGIEARAARQHVDQAIAQKRLERAGTYFTTHTALRDEKLTLTIEKAGREAILPILDKETATHQLVQKELTTSQHRAASMMLTTTHRVSAVQGLAGTGKSHMLSHTIPMIQDEGYKVRALAPYAAQVKALQELGVQANTLQSFINAKDKQIDDKTVIILDEAGVVPTRLMRQTLQIAEKAGARLVMIGDTGQTKAIEAGRPFAQLQSHGMQTTLMDEIQRQKDRELKEAVELAASGQSSRSLEKITHVSEVRNDTARYQTIVDEYTGRSEAEREKTLIVSGTNKARREMNDMIRSTLELKGQGREYDLLIRRDTTREERKYAKHYNVGELLQPERDYQAVGLQRGELYAITGITSDNCLQVRRESTGEELSFNPMRSSKLSVYSPERAEISVGDQVRITRNNAALDIANGDRFSVREIRNDEMVLEDDKRLVTLPTTDPTLHLDHAYVSTVYSAQGLTTDKVLIDLDTDSITTSKDIYYVAVSRARYEAQIYTNNQAKLPAAIAREVKKHAAMDITRHYKQFERSTLVMENNKQPLEYGL